MGRYDKVDYYVAVIEDDFADDSCGRAKGDPIKSAAIGQCENCIHKMLRTVGVNSEQLPVNRYQLICVHAN